MMKALFGPYGAQSLEYADKLPEYEANAVWFHGFDEKAYEVCLKHGITPCVEFKTFRANFAERPDLIPIGVDQQPIRYGRLVQGICMSGRDFIDKTFENLKEGLKKFKPEGIWLDYLTYGGWFESVDPDLQDSCFCHSCIDDFCSINNIEAGDPYHLLSEYGEMWKEHKCKKIANYAAQFADIIRTQSPGCIIGAYMCPYLPEEYDNALERIFAQDYSLLCDSIDIFTPLIYVKKSGRTNDWGRNFLEKSLEFIPAKNKAQLIIDYKDFPESMERTAMSGVPSFGIQIFAGGEIFANEKDSIAFRDNVIKIRNKL